MQNSTQEPAKSQGTVQMAPDSAYTTPSETQHHPWRRFFASMFDFTVFPLILALIFEAIYLRYQPYPTIIVENLSLKLTPFVATFITLQVALYIGGILLIAAVLQHTGTTLGKWIFGIKVVRQDGSYMSYRLALKRELDVFIKGIWLGIPVLCLIPIWLAYQQLTTTGSTQWDKELGLSVRYRPDGVLQVVLNVLGVLLYLIAFNINTNLAFPLSGLLIADLFSH